MTDFLALSRSAYEQSTDYWQSNYYRQWERNISNFRSKHPPGSKYNSDLYKHRSRLFRPKTRSVVRRAEAACAKAFFSTDDVVTIEAEDKADKISTLRAAIRAELLNYRLSGDEITGIPWFELCLMGYQDALTMGAVCSYQSWEYEASADRPRIDLIPIENIRFDPGADPTNPVGTSPYWIELLPMYVPDVEERMSGDGPDVWKTISREKILSAQHERGDFNSVRQQREGRDRQDPKSSTSDRVSGYEIVWVHRNFIRADGDDMMFYTLSTDALLSDPRPVKDVYPALGGLRPYTFGYCIIESHRTMPSSPIQLGESIQSEANDIANQRRDNVKLVLNKRYHIRRSANVDIRALQRNVPGGAVQMENVDSDVKVVNTPDVTGSSFAEEDRLNLDMDEITGAFSSSSVQSNRRLNETVGGMQMMSDDANTISEYQLRVFSESWVKPTLRQIDRLESYYETSQEIISIASGRVREWVQFARDNGIQEVPDELISGNVRVRVNVGFGATNPQRRIEKLAIGLRTLAEVAPQKLMQLDAEEVANEIFGALGYENADRFFVSEEGKDPKVTMLEQKIQQLTATIESEQYKEAAKAESQARIEQMRAELQARIEQMRIQGQIQLKQISPPDGSGEKAAIDRMKVEQSDRVAQRDAAVKLEIARLESETRRAIEQAKIDAESAKVRIEEGRQQIEAGRFKLDVDRYQVERDEKDREIRETDGVLDGFREALAQNQDNLRQLSEQLQEGQTGTADGVTSKIGEMEKEIADARAETEKVLRSLESMVGERERLMKVVVPALKKHGSDWAKSVAEKI